MPKDLREPARDSLYARTLIEASLDPLVTISPDGKITDVNHATEEVTGVPRERLVGTDFADYFTDPETARRGYEAVLEAGLVRDYPLTIRHVSGRLTPVLYNATVYRDEAGTLQGVFAAARDVTERERAEAERLRMEEQLRQAQKLEAVARLAGGVAHEFSNVLTVIMVAADFLSRDVGAEVSRERIEDIRQAAARAAALTRQLLVFSRRNLVAPRALDLNVVVASMDRMLRPLIGENVELVVETDSALERVRADPSQLAQVVANLVVNARDAMPAGGRITIRTANAAPPADGLPGARPGRRVLLSVSDTGEGMDADVRAHMFEPFFTTKPAGKGTGLGLSTVYSIVKQAGGDVRVASEPGAGTTVEVFLPCANEAPAAAVIQGPRGSESILLVEDEPALRGLEVQVLRELGYEVVAAGDGEEACRISARRSRPFDLIVTDVVMPRLGGRELVSRVRAERPGTAALFVSGYAEPGRGFDAKGPDGTLLGGPLLQKPFTAELLARSVREVLDRRTAAAVAPAAPVTHPA